MPTIRQDKQGFNVLSRRFGRNQTHQVTSEGVEYLQARFGDIDGVTIDRDTFFDLWRRKLIYTNKQKRRQRGQQEQLFQPAVDPGAEFMAAKLGVRLDSAEGKAEVERFRAHMEARADAARV